LYRQGSQIATTPPIEDPSAAPPGQPTNDGVRDNSPQGLEMSHAAAEAPAATDPEAPVAVDPETTPDPAPAHDPETAPDPPAAVFAGEPELQTVAACWPAVIDIVRQDNEMLAALLADARPVSLDGHDVTIAFPSDMAFLKKKAEQDEYRRATAEALRSVVGASLALRYELSDEQPATVVDVGFSHDELVRRLVEEFDAQVLDDDQEDN
jgi:hypothetical protein